MEINNMYKITKIKHDKCSGFLDGRRVNFPTVHFGHDYDSPQLCTFSLFDVNSKTTVFCNTQKIDPNITFFVGGGPATFFSGNLKFRIHDEEDNVIFEEEFTTNGSNRTPIVNGTPIYFKSYMRDKIFQTVAEIFYREVYRNDFVQIDKDDVVVDIGANVGIFSVWVLQFSPKKVIAVEPEKNTFSYLQENTKDFNNIITIKKAIADKEDVVELTTTEQSRANYIATHHKNLDENIRTSYDVTDVSTCTAELAPQMIETITISQLIKDNELKKIDFLKVDCEGGELDLFQTIDKEYLKNNVKKIAVEYHSPHIKETLIKILSDNGFSFEKIENEEAIGMILAYNKNLFNPK